MILYNAEDIRIGTGTEEVLEVRAGSDLVWSRNQRNQFWTFATPAAGTELGIKANWVSGDVTINWGDGSSDALTKSVLKTHIYGPTVWTITQLGQDIDGEAGNDFSGYSVSMNDAGNRVAIGAIRNSDNGNYSGHTRIYEWRQYTSNNVGLYNYESRLQNGTQTKPLIITEDITTAPVVGQYYWTQLGQDIDGEVGGFFAGDQSGYSVSMNADGDRVAIGAIYNGSNSGHTRIYEYDVNTQAWVQLGQDINGEAVNDYSGHSVSMNDAGNRVAIGAIGNDGNGFDSGHTRIYEYNGTNWTQLGSDIDGEAEGDQSGYSVSMNADGDRVAIGAIYNGSDSGHVRIYEWRQYISNDVGLYHHTTRVQDDTQTKPLIITPNFTIPVVNDYYWVQLGQDIDGEAANDNSGYSVSMNYAGNRVAIGAPYNDDSGDSSGHTRIYEYSNGTWSQLGQDIDGEVSSDFSGYSVSMNDAGNRVAIGAINNDGNGSQSGHVRIYEYNGTNWTQLSDDIYGDPGDNSGYSVSMNAVGNRVAIGAVWNDDNGINSGHTRIYELNSN